MTTRRDQFDMTATYWCDHCGEDTSYVFFDETGAYVAELDTKGQHPDGREKAQQP